MQHSNPTVELIWVSEVVKGKKAKIYIAGKMNGIEDYNRPLFTKVHKELEQCGFEVVNPHIINEGLDHKAQRHQCMDNDLNELRKCDCMMLLPGLDDSRGVTLEKSYASF